MRVLLVASAFVLLAIAAVPAHAQPAVASSLGTAPSSVPADWQPPVAAVGGTRADFSRALQIPVDGLVDAARSIHLRLLVWGQNLLVLLTGVSLAWLGLKTMLDRGALGELMSEFLTLTLVAGMLFAVLDNWALVTASIVSGTADVARQVSGNVQDGAAAIHGVQRVVDAGLALWEYPSATLVPVFEWPAWAANLGFKLLIVALLLICGAIYLGMYLMSMTLLAIAFSLGPVMIPWLMLRPASFLFDGWLRFTLIAALYQVVGIVIVTLVSRMHESTLESLGTAIGGNSELFNFYYFSASFMLSGVSAMLMLQIPAIASGLVNGAASLRFQTGASIVAAADRAAGRVAGAGVRSTAGAAARAGGSGRSGPGPSTDASRLQQARAR